MNNKTKENSNENKDFHKILSDADSLYEKGSFHQAISLYTKSLEIAPKNPSIWNNKGVALQQTKQYKNAINCYKKAIDIDPYYEQALMNLAALYYQQKEFEQAIKCYIKVLEINPDNIEAKQWKKLSEKHINDSRIEKLPNEKVKFSNLFQIDYKDGEVIGTLDGDIPNQYNIIKKFEGGMGYVYIVYEANNKESLYAIKTYKMKYFLDKEINEKFKHEAYTWISLGYHPNIVMAMYVKPIHGQQHIIMEYIPGGDLSQYISNTGMDINQVLDYAIQICSGMEYAYKTMQLIHRDIKPQNILLTNDGIAKITDFGISSTINTQEAEGLTPEYASPEQFNGMELNTRSDIYSYGVVLYEMVTGKKPYQLSKEYENAVSEVQFFQYKVMHCEQQVLNPKQIRKDCPNKLAAIILQCLQKKQGKRFQSFSMLKNELVVLYKEYIGEEYVPIENEITISDGFWYIKGMALDNLGLNEEAIACFDMALELNSQKEEYWINKGISLDKLGRYKAALECYEMALKINPQAENAWNCKGIALEHLEQLEDALLCFDKILKINPNNRNAWGNKGSLLVALKRFDEVIECYDKVLEINPHDDSAWLNKGLFLNVLGRFKEAVDCFDRLLEFNPQYEKAWFGKGCALKELEQYDEALECFDNVLTLNPQHSYAWNDKGCILQIFNLKEDALACFNKAIEYDPEYIEALHNQAQLLGELKQYDEAITSYNKILDFDLNNPGILYKKALACALTDRYQEAKQCCLSILEFNPTDKDVIKLLDDVKEIIDSIDESC